MQQHAIWRRGEDLGGDMLIDALEHQILFSEFKYMNENNTDKSRITIIDHEEEQYKSYLLTGEYWCLYPDDIKMELFTKNSKGIMCCFLTHKNLYEFGLNSMKQLSNLKGSSFLIEATAEISDAAFRQLTKLRKQNAEHKVTVFGRRDQDVLTNLLNRQFVLIFNSIKLNESKIESL